MAGKRRRKRRGGRRHGREPYQFTYRRKAALHKAALKSAAIRSSRGIGNAKHIAIGSVGVLAVGVGAAVMYGRKHSGPQSGGPRDVINHTPPKADPTSPLGPKDKVSRPGIRLKEARVGDVVEFKRKHRVNAFDSYETYEYGQIMAQDNRSVSVRISGGDDDNKILQGINRRNITGHRIRRRNVSPHPSHISDANWQAMVLHMGRVIRE